MRRNVAAFLLLYSYVTVVIVSSFGLHSQILSLHDSDVAPGDGRLFPRSVGTIRQCATNDNYEHILCEMTRFFAKDMVDPTTNRFYYLCLPPQGQCKHAHFPIRDLAAAWDATKALEFSYSLSGQENVDLKLKQQNLRNAIQNTLHFYSTSFSTVNQHGAISLDELILDEAPNIGHSAILLLGTCNALKLGILKGNEIPVDGLVKGILSMQLENGAFATQFADPKNFMRGIEFFPGEAMLALMTVREMSSPHMLEDRSVRADVLFSMDRAFEFYLAHFQTGTVDVNYNIWQALAFAKLYDATLDGGDTIVRKEQVADYVLTLCQEIVQSRSWRYELARGKSFYVNLATVEIACGLDAVAEGYRVAKLEQNEEKCRLFELHIRNAVDFLQWSQDQVSPVDRTNSGRNASSTARLGVGGLGYGGIQILEQRIDVTGHAISALTKLHQLSRKSKSV
eukprot:scaffold1754_cov105-Cylindrotheca_fusiformis.AAC.12